ncbi:MAG: hypothetical protein RX318_03385 [bacterium]|nr:hypothetical protein [bacterium]
MLKNSVFVLVLVAIMCNLLTGGELLFAQTELSESPKIPDGVQVKVVIITALGSITKNEIASCVNRELRSLGDVVLTDSNPRYRVHIIASGIIVFTVITDTLNSMNTGNFLALLNPALQEQQIDEEDKKVINHLAKLATTEEQVIDSWMAIVASGGVDSFCKPIVAWFDSRVLERDRKGAQQQLEELRKLQQNK